MNEIVFKLLQETTSIQVVSNFLKALNLSHSASSWGQLIQNRLSPAVVSGQISLDDLYALLKDAEENGRQHVFLYHCNKDNLTKYFSSDYWSQIVLNDELKKVIEAPLLLDQPSAPTITDIRKESVNGRLYLVIKVVESRSFMKSLDQSTDGNIITKRFELVKERAVNVARLCEDGILELKLQSNSNSSNYETDIKRFWSRISRILQEHDFFEFSIRKAKSGLWENRSKLKNKVRFSKFVVKNLSGVSMDISCGPQDQDITSSTGAVKSIGDFVSDDGEFDKCNVWFTPFNGKPSKDLHVILTKKLNEFAIPSNCTLEEYEYVLNELKSINV